MLRNIVKVLFFTFCIKSVRVYFKKIANPLCVFVTVNNLDLGGARVYGIDNSMDLLEKHVNIIRI